jgi:pseudouridine synthase
MQERLQKVIARSGLASRREAEQWIAQGRITVNESVVVEAGTKVDQAVDSILIDGEPLPVASKPYYLVFNKPRNVLVSRSDSRGRPLIYDYLKDLPSLVHPVGRLDFDSEGLLLLTNDGDLNYRLTHPSREIPKTYHVKVKGSVNRETQECFLDGVKLEDGLARAVSSKVLKRNPSNCWLEIVVTEGRNRLIRRMCDAIGHPVLRLVRMAIGNLELGGLKPGEYRSLSQQEIKKVKTFSKDSMSKKGGLV